jgi:mannose-6-phosphate isomerase-like protein (cupin superfamily)
MSTELRLSPHEVLTVREHSADRLMVEAAYAPGGSPPPRHFHPDQSERFEVMTGRLRVSVGDAERELAPSGVLELPPRTAHRMWNPGHEPVRALWTTTPAGRTLEWFQTLDELQRSGRVGRNGMPGPLAFGVYLTEYRDVFRLAGPQWLLRPACAALGALGRRRGYAVRSSTTTGMSRSVLP